MKTRAIPAGVRMFHPDLEEVVEVLIHTPEGSEDIIAILKARSKEKHAGVFPFGKPFVRMSRPIGPDGRGEELRDRASNPGDNQSGQSQNNSVLSWDMLLRGAGGWNDIDDVLRYKCPTWVRGGP